MRLRVLILLILVIFWQVAPVFAQEKQHITTIINQVRGPECCGAGGLNELKDQIDILKNLGLRATFTARYDALANPRFAGELKRAQLLGNEIGLLLEVTPALATKSGVLYRGNEANWYEAGNVMLLGYSPEDRTKLLSTMMTQYRQVFGHYPLTTTAWMIDSQSLVELKTKYGVETHQITREQWGTDSYTLSGGPPSQPYRPSRNWALIPDPSEKKAPLIVRQTIPDALWNYGDLSNSFTSQPNDYRLASRGFDYFIKLFNQAHNQENPKQTFALIGLENSMPDIDQAEFAKQLEYVAKWQKERGGRSVQLAREVAESWNSDWLSPELLVGEDGSERSYWVTTPKYRLRLRLSGGELRVSDLRLYDPALNDPYATYQAERAAYWVVPFLVDSSRFGHTVPNATVDTIWQDQGVDLQTPILASNLKPEDIVFTRNNDQLDIKINQQAAGSFALDGWTWPKNWPWVAPAPVAQRVLNNWQWQGASKEILWEIKQEKVDNKTKFTPIIYQFDLNNERTAHYPFLLPELKARPLDPQQSRLYFDRRFVQAARNPARLVWQPRDQFGYPVLTPEPVITVQGQEVDIVISPQHKQNGNVFIDFTSELPQRARVKIKFENIILEKNITFAPNCRLNTNACLRQPFWAWLWLQTNLSDRYALYKQKHGIQ